MPPRRRSARPHPVRDPPPAARAPGGGARGRLRLLQRLQTSQRFRDWALGFPLTRPVARRRARALFDLCAGFVYSQTLVACQQLDLFAILAEAPAEIDALAARCGAPAPALARLLGAATALKLIARTGSRYRLGPLGAAMVGQPGVAAMIAHHSSLYADLADPVALLRRGHGEAMNRYWAYADPTSPCPDMARTETYSALMAASQPMVAAEVLRAIDLRPHRRLLDVAGGTGAFAIAALRAAPHLHATVFDLPSVATQAAENFSDHGMSDRATAIGGDIFGPSWPADATILTLIRVLHDHDDAHVHAILRGAHAALPPGSAIVVAEPLAGTKGARSVGAYFSMYLLAMGQGRPRTRRELSSALVAAGFDRVRNLPTRAPLITSVLTARRP